MDNAKAVGAKLSKNALLKAPRVPLEKVQLIAEFVGTYMLVFAVGLNKTTGAHDKGLKTFGPTSIACTLMVLIYALGNISGGHFNPAVTFAAVIHKAARPADKDKGPAYFDPRTGLMYMVTQLVAGALAGLTTIALYGDKATNRTQGSIGPPAGWESNLFIGACLVEFLYTFLLCFVALNVCRPGQKNSYYGLAIGFVVIAGGYGGGFVSGGSFNPAITLGMNIMTLTGKALTMLPIIGCEMLGGFFAVTFFRMVRPSEAQHDPKEDLIPKLEAFSRMIEGKFDPEDTAEFLGTTFLVLTICLNGMLGEIYVTNSAGDYVPHPGAAALSIGSVWSTAATLMCMIFAVGDVSGGLFNPALTVAFLGRYLGTGVGIPHGHEIRSVNDVKKLCDPLVKWDEAVKYLFWQFVGGGAGAGLCVLVYLTSELWPATVVGPKDGFTNGQAFFAEFYGTFLLCFIVLCVATRANPLTQYLAFCIGGCIVAAGYAFGPLSGGLLNPAVTLANGVLGKLAIITSAGPITFMLAQVLGGVFAALLFRLVTHREEIEKIPRWPIGASAREVVEDSYHEVSDA